MKKKWLSLILLFVLVSGCRENYLAEKEFYKALKLFKQAQPSLNSENPDILSVERVSAAFKKVADRYPGTPKAAESLFILSDFKVKQGRLADAHALLREIILNYTGVGTWASEARFRIAQIYELESRWPEAEAMYWETAEYHPYHPKGVEAPLYLILHYFVQEEGVEERDKCYQKVVRHYQIALTAAGSIQNYAGLTHSLALSHWIAGHWDEAKEVWLSAVESFPDSFYAPVALMTLAEGAWQKQELEEASKYFDQLFTNYPAHPLAKKSTLRRGILYQELGEFTNARSWFERALKNTNVRDSEAIAEIKLLIGKSYQQEGNWPEAEKAYREIETSHPKTRAALEIPLTTALHLKESGENLKARNILESAIAHYAQIEQDFPDSNAAAYARVLQNEAYGQLGEWNQVMLRIDEDIEKEKGAENKGNWLFLKAFIAENRVQDQKQALEHYKDFLSKYPTHPLAQLAKGHADVLVNAQS